MKNYYIGTNNVQWVLRSFLLARCGLEYSEFTFKDDKIWLEWQDFARMNIFITESQKFRTISPAPARFTPPQNDYANCASVMQSVV